MGPTRQSLKSIIAWVAEAPWLNRERLRVYPKIFLVAYALSFTVWVMTLHGMVSRQGKPIGVDFQVNWAGSEMALRGQPSAVYDMKKFHALEQEVVGQRTFLAPWIYPPTFLVIVLPTALLPYLWALCCMDGTDVCGLFTGASENHPAHGDVLAGPRIPRSVRQPDERTKRTPRIFRSWRCSAIARKPAAVGRCVFWPFVVQAADGGAGANRVGC